jgi:hypothetical protein
MLVQYFKDKLYGLLNYFTKRKSDVFEASADRSGQWRTFRNNLVKNAKCAICGSSKNLQAHHKKPFKDFPELELDPDNIVILCENPNRNCHFVFGHLFNWSHYNDDIINTIQYFQIIVKKAKIRAYRKGNRPEA